MKIVADANIPFVEECFSSIADVAVVPGREIDRDITAGADVLVVRSITKVGESRKWVLDHVRAGKDEVIAEIEAAGFQRSGESSVQGLRENYMIHFTRE